MITGTSITLLEAARRCGVNKSTMQRAVRSGKISATRTDAGTWLVEAGEVFRVFPPAADTEAGTEAVTRSAPADAATDALVATLNRVIEDLRQDRDAWKEQAQRLALASPRRPWWPWRRAG